MSAEAAQMRQRVVLVSPLPARPQFLGLAEGFARSGHEVAVSWGANHAADLLRNSSDLLIIDADVALNSDALLNEVTAGDRPRTLMLASPSQVRDIVKAVDRLRSVASPDSCPESRLG
jgi:hypothetical protein